MFFHCHLAFLLHYCVPYSQHSISSKFLRSFIYHLRIPVCQLFYFITLFIYPSFLCCKTFSLYFSFYFSISMHSYISTFFVLPSNLEYRPPTMFVSFAFRSLVLFPQSLPHKFFVNINPFFHPCLCHLQVLLYCYTITFSYVLFPQFIHFMFPFFFSLFFIFIWPLPLISIL